MILSRPPGPSTLLTCAVLVFSGARLAEAGTNVWTSHGPEGGYVSALAINPNTPSTLYVGTGGGGVFKSTDSGDSWKPAGTGLLAPVVLALAVEPNTPSTLYAGTWGDGVFESTDRGGSWNPVNTGLPTTLILTLAVAPTTPSTLYAGTWGGGVVDIEQIPSTPTATATPTPTSTATPTATPTSTATPTATSTPTMTLTPTPLCAGDCDGSGEVTVNELTTMVNITLGNAALSACPRGDGDGSGDITINEIIAATNNALNGCDIR